MTADDIDRTSPAFFAQRLARRRELSAVKHLDSTESFNVVSLLRPATDPNHCITQFREYGRGHTAHTASGASHKNLTIRRFNAMTLQRQHTQHRGIASGAN